MTIYPQSLADQDWPRRMREDRARFARELSGEMQKLAAQMQVLATLADFYFTDTLQVIAAGSSETDEHRRAPLDPAPAPARPPARSSAMASRVRDVGAAPAGTAERPPQPIPLSDSTPPPRAVPAGPLAVESPPAAPPEDKPIPQPAPFPSVQNEAEGIQGEDQRAQNEVGAPNATSAGAASAGHRNADPRNSSRAPSSEPSGPVGGARTEPPLPMKEQVVRLWSTTDLTREAIAAEVGCKLGSVDAFLSQARAKGDRRGFARATMTQTFGAVPERDSGEREAPVSGLSKSPAPKPFDRLPSEPLNPRPGRFAGVIITSPGDVVSIDMDNLVIACPGGDWQVARPVALVMERMRNGETFDHKTLADIGSMGLETFKSSMPRWTEQLAARGVEFVSTKGVGCKIRLAEAA